MQRKVVEDKARGEQELESSTKGGSSDVGFINLEKDKALFLVWHPLVKTILYGI